MQLTFFFSRSKTTTGHHQTTCKQHQLTIRLFGDYCHRYQIFTVEGKMNHSTVECKPNQPALLKTSNTNISCQSNTLDFTILCCTKLFAILGFPFEFCRVSLVPSCRPRQTLFERTKHNTKVLQTLNTNRRIEPGSVNSPNDSVSRLQSSFPGNSPEQESIPFLEDCLISLIHCLT